MEGRKQWKASNPAGKGRGDYGCISRLTYVPCPSKKLPPSEKIKVFKPCGNLHNRMSMWAVNPYECDARPAPDNDLSLLG